MKESTVISALPACFIELIHRRSNPTMWIVKRYRKRLWFKKQLSSHWFIDGQQALAFAQTMKRTHEAQIPVERRLGKFG